MVGRAIYTFLEERTRNPDGGYPPDGTGSILDVVLVKFLGVLPPKPKRILFCFFAGMLREFRGRIS